MTMLTLKKNKLIKRYNKSNRKIEIIKKKKNKRKMAIMKIKK